jgi:hypothetical protein
MLIFKKINYQILQMKENKIVLRQDKVQIMKLYIVYNQKMN